MTVIDERETQDERKPSISPRPRPARRAGGTRPACPTERSKDFGKAVRRLARLLGAGSGTVVVRRGRRHHQRGAATCSARGCSATAPTSSSRASTPATASTSPRCTTCCSQAVALYVGVGGARRSSTAYILAGVVQRLMFRLRASVEDKVNALPLSYIDQPAARRPAQPGHERHRQHRAEPPADAEPDAHVGAAADRRRGDDVHDLAVAGDGGAHDRAGVGLRDAVRSAKRARPRFIAQWRNTGHAQRADRGDVHRPLDREGVRPPARGRGAVPRDQRRAVRGVVRRAVHVEPHAAGDDVPRQRPVRARRGRRRAAGVDRRDLASATCRPSSSTRARSRCRSRSWRR